MKRTVLISFLAGAIALTGCGIKLDPAVEAIINDIDAIGEVTVTDEQLIDSISEAYDKLTAEQKAQVRNYDDFLEAQEDLEEEKIEEQQEYEAWLREQLSGQPVEPEENDEEMYKMDAEDEMQEKSDEQLEEELEKEESIEFPDYE